MLIDRFYYLEYLDNLWNVNLLTVIIDYYRRRPLHKTMSI